MSDWEAYAKKVEVDLRQRIEELEAEVEALTKFDKVWELACRNKDQRIEELEAEVTHYARAFHNERTREDQDDE
jgi:prefoldin subunit 5